MACVFLLQNSRSQLLSLEDSHIGTLRTQNNLQHPLLCGYTHKQIQKGGQTCSFHSNKTHIQSENVLEMKSL